MIVTLAGHVDHGKTTLVRLLTGTDTDRLSEEKRRGLTIDLGFAYLRGEHGTIGFVDVPGHHRFIHNMVAGIAATQHALLVVAADDGPMPQSREHLQILELLGIGSGVIALTKGDLVSAERLLEARALVQDMVRGTFLADAPIIETSMVTGSGLDALRSHLLDHAAHPPASVEACPFRMPVDRAFTLKGAGLVVTGTVHGGRVRIEDEVYVFPTGAQARVRDLRVQDAAASVAGAGDRAAVNLTGLGSARLERGAWLCQRPEAGHRRLVVDLRVIEDFPRDVRHFAPVHVYHATSHSTGRLALLEGTRLRPGERALAELLLDQPLLGKRGDRVVVRDTALEYTLGGGSIIDNRPWPGRRRARERLRVLQACAHDSAAESLRALLALGPVETQPFIGLWNLRPDDFTPALAGVNARSVGEWLVDERAWDGWRGLLRAECEARHRDDPALQGLRENQFRAPVPGAFRMQLLNELTADGELQQRAGRFQPSRHQAALSSDETQLFDRLRPLLDQEQPPSLGDLAKMLKIPLPRLKAGVKALASKDRLVEVGDKRVYLPDYLARLADLAAELSARGDFTAREFRDAAGIGRNVAIDVLEHFDARGFTRRRGDTRRVVPQGSPSPGAVD